MSADDNAEDDRRRIARELHDDIGQRLALLADDADSLRRDLNLKDAAARHRFDILVEQARAVGEDLRKISHALHPAILEDLGLGPAIRSLTDDFAVRTGNAARFTEANVPHPLPPSLATALYRITQEALRNIAKHAGPAAVRVALECVADEIVLTIADSGIGFDSAQSSGLGLISMRERASLAGGTLTVTSTPGQGTTVEARLRFHCVTKPFSTA